VSKEFKAELKSVDLNPLTMEEAVLALLDGELIIVRGLEQRTDADVLVRLYSKGKIPVTQISYDTQPLKDAWRDQYWIVYDIPLNVFSTYPCFIYNEEVAKQAPKFMVGETVRYDSRQESSIKSDSAIILDVLSDGKGNWYYELSRDSEIYQENELTRDKLG